MLLASSCLVRITAIVEVAIPHSTIIVLVTVISIWTYEHAHGWNGVRGNPIACSSIDNRQRSYVHNVVEHQWTGHL